MTQPNSRDEPVDVDQVMKNEMEKIVPTYDAYMRNMTLGRERALRDMTVNLAQVKPGDCVLEVGCGTGTLTLAAKRQAGRTGQVFGIDVIPGVIETSQRKAEQAQEAITFQLGSIDNIPFPANYFDAVLSSFMIFHMSEATRRKGMAEVYRVLKPQGRWLIVDLALPPQPLQRAIAQRLLGSMLEHDLRELLPAMEATGFSNLEVAPAKLRLLGLPVVAYLRARAHRN